MANVFNEDIEGVKELLKLIDKLEGELRDLAKQSKKTKSSKLMTK